MLNDTKSLLGELVAFSSISSQSNIELVNCLAARLRDAGADVEIYPNESGTKANLFATIGPKVDGGVVLSGHTDVVPVAGQDWKTDPFEMTEIQGKLFGRGTCDMKGFIAAAVSMAPHYAAQNLKRPIHFAFTRDEEIGCFGAKALAQVLRKEQIKPAIAIVGEPTSMRIIEGHKGCYEYSTHFVGREGHGSSPDLGVNAVEYAARYVGRLLQLEEDLKSRAPADSGFRPPWSTINVGALNGGIAHNVIPGKARLDWEMRPVQKADADFVKGQLQHYCDNNLTPAMQAVSKDAHIILEVIAEVDGLTPTSENEAREILRELTGVSETDLVPFGTEAGIFQDIGMDVVVCGPGSIHQAHKPNEFLEISQLEQSLDLLERLTQKIT